jgi:PAS domain S-box-containing protein
MRMSPHEQEQMIIDSDPAPQDAPRVRVRVRGARDTDADELRDTFENAPIAIRWASGDGVILRANRAELALLGYETHEYVGHHLAEFHADRHVADEFLARLRRGEIVRDFEARLLRKDGSVIDVLIDSSVVRRDGEFAHTRCFTRDNTRWKQLEDRLRESEQLYQDLYDNAPDMFTSVDARTGTYVGVNETFARMTGYTKEELIGRPVFDLYHPDSQPTVQAAFDEFVRTGEVHDAPLLLLRKDHSVIPVSLNLSATRDAAGNVLQSRSVLRDMRDRVRALAEKDHAIAVLDTLLTMAPIGFVLLDSERRFVRVNASAAEMSGLSVEQHIGRRLDEVLPGMEPQAACIERVLETGEVVRNVELHAKTPSQPGVERFWVAGYYPVREAATITGVGIVYQEISERKRVENTLRRQASLLDQSHDAIIVRELDSGRILYWSRGAAKLYGWEPAVAAGMTTHQLLHTEHPDGHARIDEVLAHEGAWDGELSHVTQRGDRIAVESRQVVLTEGDKPLVLETNRDISDRKRGLDELRLSEERYRTLAEAIPAMVSLTRPDGGVEYVSQSLLDYTGMTRDEAYAGQWTKILHPDDLAEHAEEWVGILGRGEALAGEVRIRRADGTYRWHFGRVAPVRDADGSVRLFVGAHVDIDDRKRTEDDLLVAAAELERANAAKDEFLGLVSHELKTPITTIYGNAQVLRVRGDKLDDDSRKGALDDIVDESERLHRIIDNLLVLARLEQGQEIDAEPLLVRRIASVVVAEHRQHHPYRNVRLTMTKEPMPVNGQALYLEQVIRNLLSNAEKYSPTSEPIDIDISRGGDELHFSVLDRGRGVATGEEEKIFTPFYRSPTARQRASGVGIGLAVCKRLVEAQGGRMWARARDGGGADIGFALPIVESGFDD